MVSGIVNVLKPPGMTSHDVISFLRKMYGIKRIGHAGTLDPAAAGVLPVAVGQATRLIEYMSNFDKKYRAELTLGISTDTGDDTGRVIHSASFTMPTWNQLEVTLHSFLGEINQTPPMYSAIKIGGKKMYELARDGIVIERQSRSVFIKDISLLRITDDKFVFDVTCSKGTYIRTLCSDIGEKIGCPAVMSFLVRMRVGNLPIHTARTLEEIAKGPLNALLPADTGLDYMAKVELKEQEAHDFKQGKSLKYNSPDGLLRIYDHQNLFIGIGRCSDSSILSPIKVLSLV